MRNELRVDFQQARNAEERRAVWLKALRSGAYRRGIGQLAHADAKHYCCMGVLCDLADPARETWNREWSFPPKEITALVDWKVDPFTLAEVNDDLDLRGFRTQATMIEKGE